MRPSNPFAGKSAAEIVQQSVLHPSFAKEQRNVRIRDMRASGKSLNAVGGAFGLTRARVSQICKDSAHPQQLNRQPLIGRNTDVPADLHDPQVFAQALDRIDGPAQADQHNHVFI